MINRRDFFTAGAGACLLAGCSTMPGIASGGVGRARFRAGMAGYTCRNLSVDDTLALMKRIDVNYLCVKDFHLPFTATADEIAAFRRKCADHGVTPYGIGPIYMETEAEADRAFDFARKVGVGLVVGVPVLKKDGKRFENHALCRYVEGLCRKYDIRYAIHNHGPESPNLFPTGESSWNAVRDLDERMGLCLDVGHDFRFGKDPVDSIHAFASRIFDVHIKNVKKDPKRLLTVPMPRGEMDVWAIVKALADVGYDGCCSFEYENFPEKGVVPGIRESDVAESIGYFKGLVRALDD